MKVIAKINYWDDDEREYVQLRIPLQMRINDAGVAIGYPNLGMINSAHAFQVVKKELISIIGECVYQHTRKHISGSEVDRWITWLPNQRRYAVYQNGERQKEATSKNYRHFKFTQQQDYIGNWYTPFQREFGY